LSPAPATDPSRTEPPRPVIIPGKPWESPDLFSPRPDAPDYGYVADRQRFGCTPEELVARCRASRPHVDLVWTPQAPRLVPPAEVPWLLDAVRERTRDDLRHNVLNGVGLVVVWSVLALLSALRGKGYPLPLLIVLVLMLGVVPLVQPAWGLWRLRRRPDYPKELAATFRYQVWLGTRRMTTTWLLAACLILVAAAQVGAIVWAVTRAKHVPATAGLVVQAAGEMGVAAPVAGLVKDAVRAGEVWRLLTGELMHGHWLHFLFNFLALLAVGRLVEMHGHPVYVPTVFLFSALCASVFSLYLSPAPISVGASGGIMGLVGFLAVLGLRRRHVVPRGFLKSIALTVALTAATGLVAYHFIDNAAHAGGLVGGAMLGVTYIRRRSGEAATDAASVRIPPSTLARVAGWISAAALVVATLATVWLLISAVRA
jgi:membrane associated rhomboid family serine protease